MMKKPSPGSVVPVAMLAFFLALLVAPSAMAETKSVVGSSTGTFERSNNSTNTGTQFALSSRFNGSDNIGGPHAGHQLLQFDFFTGDPCPAELARFGLEAISGFLSTANTVLTYNQGQLFLLTTEANGCMDFSTGEYTLETTSVITGGTGKYANSTGEIASIVSGRVLLSPNFNGSRGQFGAFESVQSGEIDY